METVKITPWLYVIGLVAILVSLAVVIWKSRKEFPSDHVRRDLFNIWWMLAIISVLTLVDRVYIYVCLP